MATEKSKIYDRKQIQEAAWKVINTKANEIIEVHSNCDGLDMYEQEELLAELHMAIAVEFCHALELTIDSTLEQEVVLDFVSSRCWKLYHTWQLNADQRSEKNAAERLFNCFS